MRCYSGLLTMRADSHGHTQLGELMRFAGAIIVDIVLFRCNFAARIVGGEHLRLVRKGSAFDNPWLLRLLGLAGSLYAVIGGVNTWLRLVEVR